MPKGKHLVGLPQAIRHGQYANSVRCKGFGFHLPQWGDFIEIIEMSELFIKFTTFLRQCFASYELQQTLWLCQKRRKQHRQQQIKIYTHIYTYLELHRNNEMSCKHFISFNWSKLSRQYEISLNETYYIYTLQNQPLTLKSWHSDLPHAQISQMYSYEMAVVLFYTH